MTLGLVTVHAALFLIVAVVSGGLLSLWRHDGSSATASALQILAPFALAWLACLALGTPDPYQGGCHCLAHGMHHPHLCFAHPEHAGAVVLPALLVVLVVLVASGRDLARQLTTIIRSEVAATRMRALPESDVDGVAVRFASCPSVGAFTAGVFRPLVVVDRELFDQLPPEHRRAIVHHEAAHVARRDPLTFAVLRLASALVPGRALMGVVARWKVAAERACDAYAGRRLGDASVVAEALVAVSRGAASATGTDAHRLEVVDGLLEERVRALLDARAAPTLANDVLGLALVLLGVSAVVVAWPTDIVHHGAETLLGLIVH